MLAGLKQLDPEIAAAIEREADRQETHLELIASENFVSRAVMEAVGSVLTNKYAEGYPGKRYYGGCEFVDQVEILAQQRLKQLFGAEFVNVQPHSGSQANMAVYLAELSPGDTVMGMSLAHGGHLTHGSPVNFSGLLFKIVSYGVRRDTGRIDYDQMRDLAREHKPKLIVVGASAYPRILDFDAFRAVADEVGAKLMVDIAHIAGLVVAGEHPSPVPVAEYVTSTTHKTLRGPRGGIIMGKAAYEKKINSRIFPGIQGGPLMHVIAGKAVAFKEALQPEFRLYQQQIRKNACALADTLLERGYELVSGGTDNHLMLVDLSKTEVTGKEAEDALGVAGITVNKNAVPFDTRPPAITSGIRIGTPAVTTRGMKEAEMRQIGRLIDDAIQSRNDLEKLAGIRKQVHDLCQRFPLYRDRVRS